MSLFSVLNAFAFAVYVFLGLFVLLLNRRSAVNRAFFFLCAVFAWYALCYAILPFAPSREQYRDWFVLSSPGWILSPAMVLFFFLTMAYGQRLTRRWWVRALLIVPAAALLARAWTGELWAADFVRGPLGWTEVPATGSPWFWLFVVYFEGYSITGLAVCFRWSRRAGSPRERRQGQIVTIGGIATLLAITFVELGLPALGVESLPTMTPVLILIWIGSVHWAITRHRLMALTTMAAADEILRTMTDAVLLVDPGRCIATANRGAGELFGVADVELAGRVLHDLFEEGKAGVEAWFSQVAQRIAVRNREMTCRTADGRTVPVMVSATALTGPGKDLEGAVVVLRDIAERKQNEERLRYLAHHDPLTDLPNRLLFADRLGQMIARAQRYKQIVGVMHVDLDRFKEINDTFGHETGDLVLKTAARRLARSVRRSDTVSRIGGDEFAVILADVKRPEDMEVVERRILESFREPVPVGARTLQVGLSIGVTLYPQDGEDPDTLLRGADAAMYAAKAGGGGAARRFMPGMHVSTSERRERVERLREAIERREFVLHYQPQVDLGSGAIIGAEALVRWQDPEAGMVPPMRFIPLAEESGLILPLGEWVLGSACAEAAAWAGAGRADVRVAVNLSARQFEQRDLPNLVGRTLKESGLPPARLELEITESTAMRDPDATVRTLLRLRELGVRIAVDDFGTGYSSLVYLKRFPVDTLKIGQAFVRDLAERTVDTAIVAAIIGLAEVLRLELVVAEGVETQSQLDVLKSIKCRVVQGYMFGRPMPVPDFRALLATPPRPPESPVKA
jgi:diguanylate cyclase (GGDEF)-like protein/PAS domain S-box-containing protein